MVCAAFSTFRNSGPAFNGEALGARDGWAFWLNAVEITFKVTDAKTAALYRNLRPYQWSGPESIWMRTSDKGWTVYKSGPGTGEDLPMPDNWQYKSGAKTGSPATIAYYDNPGLQPGVVSALSAQGAVGIYVVQNFTGWVVGDRGAPEERLSEVVAWYSKLCILKTTAGWNRISSASGTGTGWASTSSPP